VRFLSWIPPTTFGSGPHFRPRGGIHNSRRGRLALLTALLISAGLVGCTSPPRPDATSSVLGIRMPLSDGFFSGTAWLPDGRLALAVETSQSYTAEVWLSDPARSSVQRLALPVDPACRFTQYQYPVALADGRLALTKGCEQVGGDPRVGYSSVVAYDFKDETITELASLGGRMALKGSSWGSDASRGVGAQSSGVCAGIAWLTRSGPQGIPATLGDGAKRSRLDDWLREPATASCANQVRADCPVWQPGGQAVAFFGSPAAVGVEGQARLDVPWQLYLLDSQTLRVTRAVGDIHGSCLGMSWSRDGRWLAFAGTVGQTEGIWLYSPAGKALRLVSATHPSFPDWSADGHMVVAIEQPTLQYPPKNRLIVADVSRITHL
jgi:hypothetical protein